MHWIRQITDRHRIGWQAVGLLCVVTACTIAGWQWLPRERRLPTAHFSGPIAPAANSRCADCHPSQVLSLSQAPHMQTLHRATATEIIAKFHGLNFRDPSSGEITDTFEFRDGQLWRKCSTYPAPIPLDWVFGSGRHAQTPVTVRESPQGKTELLEHRLSHYPGIGIDLTLGNVTTTRLAPGWHGLGTHMTSPDATDCFGCHTTWLPNNEGKLDLNRLVVGVQCARCHLGGESHLAAVAAGQPDSKMERWRELSPLESIRRCGECHRRDDQLTPDELRPDNLLLVRFAPVGLSQSRCFLGQSESKELRGVSLRMDCTTCHDPHREAETDASYYTERCLTCHGIQSGQVSPCSSQTSSEQCLSCHMPKIEVQPHLRFTDHWIRVRRDPKK